MRFLSEIKSFSMVLAAALAVTACVAISPAASVDPESVRCVVATDPQMRVVTFAPETGLDGGVTKWVGGGLPSVRCQGRVLTAVGPPALLAVVTRTMGQ